MNTDALFNQSNLVVNKYQGLLYVEACTNSQGEGRLLTVWNSEREWNSVRPSFLKDTGLTTVCFEGVHSGIHKAKVPWPKKLTPARIWAAVATLFVVLGYFEQVRSAAGWLIALPHVETKVGNFPIDVLVGKTFTFEVAARNTSQFGDSSIEFTQPVVDKGSGVELDPTGIVSNPVVKPGEEAKLTISGKAKRPGTHTVEINALASGGLIWKPTPFGTTTSSVIAEIRVWAPLLLGAQRFKNSTDGGRHCIVELELNVGDHFDRGIEAELKLERVTGVRFDSLNFPRVNEFSSYEVSDTVGKEVATIEWRTWELVPMDVVKFSVSLEDVGKGKTAEEWQAIVKAIQFTFNTAR